MTILPKDSLCLQMPRVMQRFEQQSEQVLSCRLLCRNGSPGRNRSPGKRNTRRKQRVSHRWNSAIGHGNGCTMHRAAAGSCALHHISRKIHDAAHATPSPRSQRPAKASWIRRLKGSGCGDGSRRVERSLRASPARDGACHAGVCFV